MRKRRHWIRGIFGGLLFGLGLGLASIVYAFNFAGPLTPWVMVLIGLAIGILLVFVPRPWGRKPPPKAPSGSAAPSA
jgi:drug/metabolite transporter (DMT)-like permease